MACNWHTQDFPLPTKDVSFDLVESLINIFVPGKFFLYNDKRKGEIRIVGQTVEEIIFDKNPQTSKYEISIKSTLPDRNGLNYPKIEADPLKQLGSIIQKIPIPDANLYGYVTFDIIQFYYPYNKESFVPLAYFFLPAVEIIIYQGVAKVRTLDATFIDKVKNAISNIKPGKASTKDEKTLEKFLDTDHEAYKNAVRALVDDIKAGQLDKAILSRPRWALGTKLDVIETYRSAFSDISARDFCFDFGSNACVGISPEPMVIVSEGEVVVTPLAGTRGRGANEEEDKKLTEELHHDKKEQYEHRISVVEVNKEMNATCLPETVKIFPLAEVQYYRTVQHLASTLRGKIKPECDAWDCLREHAPAVTVSGVNKGSAVEAIDKYEVEARGIYSGSVGWVSTDGKTADFAIAIRAVFQHSKGVKLHAGAGIVEGSTDRYELKETIKKMAMIAPHVHLKD